eukprot:s4673_g3.t1
MLHCSRVQLQSNLQEKLAALLQQYGDMLRLDDAGPVSKAVEKRASQVIAAGSYYDTVEAFVSEVYGNLGPVEEEMADFRNAVDDLDDDISRADRRRSSTLVSALSNMRQAIFENCLMPQTRTTEGNGRGASHIFETACLAEVIQLQVDTADTIERWYKVQQMWTSLESVFTGGDIAKQMPAEAKKFGQIDKDWDWLKIMHKSAETMTVVDCCQNELLRQMMPVLLAGLETCQKSLESYLEGKRQKFPRFFFTSDPVLLKILSQGGSDPDAIQDDFEKLFDAISRVTFDKSRKITQIKSVAGKDEEKVILQQPVTAHGNIEEWLQNLETEMQRSVRRDCRKAANECGNVSAGQSIEVFADKYIAQVALPMPQADDRLSIGDVLRPFQFKVDSIDDNMERTMIILHPAHAAISHRGALASAPVRATREVELPTLHGVPRTMATMALGVVALGIRSARLLRPEVVKSFPRRARYAWHTCRAASGAEWIAGEQDDCEFQSEEDYLKSLELQGTLPAGFRLASSSLKFVPQEAQEMGELPMKLTVICLDEATDEVAATFTQNAFPGAPVKLGRQRMREKQKIQALVVNNKISNVSPPDADGGVRASQTICDELAKNLQLPSGNCVLPSSTGVIGWRLPVDEMVAALPVLEDLSSKPGAIAAAKGIMTTDRYPKLAARDLSNGARLVGIAKGAGMIEPNMATMLCFLMTDAKLSPDDMQSFLSEAVSESFNAISVDGDESTSDTTVLLSSGRIDAVPPNDFRRALRELCRDLAAQVVRNGEGTQHVIRVTVSGAEDEEMAKKVGKAVVNGPLFKSAVAGNDPNVGRLIGKVGQTLGASGAAMAEGCVCKIGGETIFEDGQFRLDTEKERRLSGHLKFAAANCDLPYPEHRRVVDVEVILGGGGSGSAVVLGSDLTTEYVKINADYRS